MMHQWFPDKNTWTLHAGRAESMSSCHHQQNGLLKFSEYFTLVFKGMSQTSVRSADIHESVDSVHHSQCLHDALLE
jgi:hypothetical protein